MTPRRGFITNCSTFMAAIALAPAGAIGKPFLSPMQDISLSDVSYATLAKRVNGTFRVSAKNTQMVELELVEANLGAQNRRTAKGGPAVDAGYEKFSLIFRGPDNQLLTQNMYTFEHDNIGRFELFIVPVVSRDVSRRYYQAVFNRPLKSQSAVLVKQPN